MGSDHLDEYGAYLANTAGLPSADAEPFKIAAYVRQVVRVNMGISNFPDDRVQLTRQRSRQQKWPRNARTADGPAHACRPDNGVPVPSAG